MSRKCSSVNEMKSRLEQLDLVIARQKAFLARIPDPDNRERADGHLLQLIDMRDDIAHRYQAAQAASEAGC